MIEATLAHAEAMAAVHAAAFPPAESWDAAAFATQLAMPGVFGLIDPAGGIILARAVADEAEVLTIAVLPAARRHGIGRRLLAAAIARAGTMGGVMFFLEVSDVNTGALLLYETSGFVQIGRRRRYYPDGSDALVMRRPITCGAAAGG